MVKIIEKTLEERALEEKMQQLLGMAKEIFPNERMNITSGLVIGIHGADPFVPDCHKITIFYNNNIQVHQPSYFDRAVELARLYEARFDAEFIVKKDYQPV